MVRLLRTRLDGDAKWAVVQCVCYFGQLWQKRLHEAGMECMCISESLLLVFKPSLHTKRFHLCN
jgi:hypothetical protein